MANKTLLIIGDVNGSQPNSDGTLLGSLVAPALSTITGDNWSFQHLGAAGACLVNPSGASGYSAWGVFDSLNIQQAITNSYPFDMLLLAFGTDDLRLHHTGVSDVINFYDAYTRMLDVVTNLFGGFILCCGVIPGPYLETNQNLGDVATAVICAAAASRFYFVQPVENHGLVDETSDGFDTNGYQWSTVNMTTMATLCVQAYQRIVKRSFTIS